MSHFPLALAATLKHEGGYANDPLDRGGETYCGISRRHHPDWPGWSIIDRQKAVAADSGFDIPDGHLWGAYPALTAAVEDFYRKRFWEPIGPGLF